MQRNVSLQDSDSEEAEETVEQNETKKYWIAHVNMKHFQELADKCLEMKIPIPFASQFSRASLYCEKSIHVDNQKKIPRCYQCGLKLDTPTTLGLKIIGKGTVNWTRKHKRKARKEFLSGRALSTGRSKKSKILLTVCRGCGAETKGGRLASLDRNNIVSTSLTNERIESTEAERTNEKRNSDKMVISLETPVLLCTPEVNSSASISSKNVNREEQRSSGRHRKRSSRLMMMLKNETPTKSENNSSLQNFLDALKQ